MFEIIRQEIKFVLPPKIAPLVEDAIIANMRPDAHGMEYPVRSLYFNFNTSKLRHRLRTYASEDNCGPMFFEIKGRGELGKFKRRTEFKTGDPIPFIDSNETSLLIGYTRKAFENPDELLRVTIDYDIWATKANKLFPANPSIIRMPFNAIMEVKYHDALPEWLTMLMDDYGLRKTSFSKFEKCQEVCNDHK